MRARKHSRCAWRIRTAKRNTDLQSVRPAGLQPAEGEAADQISAGRTGNMPVFQFATRGDFVYD